MNRWQSGILLFALTPFSFLCYYESSSTWIMTEASLQEDSAHHGRSNSLRDASKAKNGNHSTSASGYLYHPWKLGAGRHCTKGIPTQAPDKTLKSKNQQAPPPELGIYITLRYCEKIALPLCRLKNGEVQPIMADVSCSKPSIHR